MNEIKQKLADLELALNYVCYDADLIPKLQPVWRALEELQEEVNKSCNTPAVSTSTVYEYGAMSSKYKLEATNKLTAYAAMILHYRNSPHLMVIYEPETCKNDSWFNPTGKISERLDEIFGGVGSFDKYLSENIEAVRACYKTITQVV